MMRNRVSEIARGEWQLRARITPNETVNERVRRRIIRSKADFRSLVFLSTGESPAESIAPNATP